MGGRARLQLEPAMGRPMEPPLLVTVRLELEDTRGNVIHRDVAQCQIGMPVEFAFAKFVEHFWTENQGYDDFAWEMDDDSLDARYRNGTAPITRVTPRVVTGPCVIHGHAVYSPRVRPA